jgi:hypothetical protein
MKRMHADGEAQYHVTRIKLRSDPKSMETQRLNKAAEFYINKAKNRGVNEALEVMADEKPKTKVPEKTHEILRHGVVIARVNGLKAASRKVDRLDQAYGASIHTYRPIKK